MKSCKIFGFALIISLMTTGALCTSAAFREVTPEEQKEIDLALQDWAQSRGLHHSLDQILAKQAAQSQANNNGDSSDGRETAAAPSMAGGPGLKPPANDEEDSNADKY